MPLTRYKRLSSGHQSIIMDINDAKTGVKMKYAFGLTEEMLRDYDLVANRLNEVALEPLVMRFNTAYTKSYLFHLRAETADLTPREHTAIRSRVGLLIEYAVISILHEMIDRDTDSLSQATFNTTNMFADFFIRGDMGKVDLRIDVKAVQAASDEKSARFTTLVQDIDPKRDFLLVIQWEWHDDSIGDVEISYPIIENAAFVSCIRMAEERDRGRFLAGGSFDTVSGKPMTANNTEDTNFGKMARIIHSSRIGAQNLDPWVLKVQGFLSAR